MRDDRNWAGSPLGRLGWLAGRLYRTSPERWVGKLRSLLGRPAPAPAAVDTPPEVTEPFLRSADYRSIMMAHLPYDGSYDLHEAQNMTASYRHRHFTRKRELGVYRWRGIQKHLERILDVVTGPERVVVDFGGAASPLGFHSVVVDLMAEDTWGRRVPYHALGDLPEPAHVIFSSHTLEHVPELDATLAHFEQGLRPRGELILHLPSFSCERWRAGLHRSARHRNHLWTFGLHGTTAPEGLQRYVEIDHLVAERFDVSLAEYCGDDSIFLVARKRPR